MTWKILIIASVEMCLPMTELRYRTWIKGMINKGSASLWVRGRYSSSIVTGTSMPSSRYTSIVAVNSPSQISYSFATRGLSGRISRALCIGASKVRKRSYTPWYTRISLVLSTRRSLQRWLRSSWRRRCLMTPSIFASLPKRPVLSSQITWSSKVIVEL